MASDNTAVQIGMKDMIRLITTFDPLISVCIRGRHAVGKSEGTYQAAALLRDDFYKDEKNQEIYNWTYEQGLPVIERRLSQLTEGDLTGMPDLGPNRKATVFKPCDWLIDACERPVVLFLDERNRALEGVKQAVFQLQDSRAFYGHKLHPGTRVIIAENIGEHYNVQQCDPAETSRPAIMELCPTVDEWLEYASTRCHEFTVSFIRNNKEHLEFNPKSTAGDKARNHFDPNMKYPDRRSWFKLDHQLVQSGLMERPDDGLFYLMSASMVGVQAALAFAKFCREQDRSVSLEEMLTDWPKAQKKLGKDPAQARFIELAKKLESWMKQGNILEDAQAKQLGLFLEAAPAEARMVAWAALQASVKNLFRAHKYAEKIMLATATGQDTSKATNQPAAAAPAATSEASASPPKQRKTR